MTEFIPEICQLITAENCKPEYQTVSVFFFFHFKYKFPLTFVRNFFCGCYLAAIPLNFITSYRSTEANVFHYNCDSTEKAMTCGLHCRWKNDALGWGIKRWIRCSRFAATTLNYKISSFGSRRKIKESKERERRRLGSRILTFYFIYILVLLSYGAVRILFAVSPFHFFVFATPASSL